MAKLNDAAVYLRMPTSLKEALQKDAKDAGLPLAVYIRMLLKRSTDTKETR